MPTLQSVTSINTTHLVSSIIVMTQPSGLSLPTSGIKLVHALKMASPNLNVNITPVRNILLNKSKNEVEDVLGTMYIGRDLITSMYKWSAQQSVANALQHLTITFMNETQSTLVN